LEALRKMNNANRILAGNPGGKRPLGEHRSRGEDNIKMDLKEIGCHCEHWIRLIHDRI
jgi:hypothetical protein